MPTLAPQSVDLVFADLPYGTTRCKWDTLINPKELWKAIDILKKGYVLLMTGGYPYYQIENIQNYKYKLYWNKKFGANFTQVKRQPFFTIEEIECYYSGTYNPQMILRDKPIVSGKRASARTFTGTDTVQIYNADKKIYTEKYPNSIIDIPRPLGTLKAHPTQKPVELMEYLIKTYTNEGDTVLDFTMGSGSTGVAALNTNRSFIGIELDAQYFSIAQERISNV
jgi:site-specific DNA-methyltransferase (adenine-specific)